MDTFAKKGIFLALALSCCLSLVLALFKGSAWGTGFMAGASWSIVNFFLTTRLMGIVANPASQKKWIGFLLFVKFPVLYGLGFLLIVSGFFPVYSLLIGLFSIFVVMRVVSLCLKPA